MVAPRRAANTGVVGSLRYWSVASAVLLVLVVLAALADGALAWFVGASGLLVAAFGAVMRGDDQSSQ